MTWVRSDDGEAHHPKMLRVPIAAFGFFQAAKQWASAHTTNGFVPVEALGPAIYPSVTRAEATRHAAVLAAAVDPARPDSKPLFEVREGGWQIHDYLIYNPSRDEVLAGRASHADRNAAGGRARAASAGRAGGRFTSQRPADAGPAGHQRSPARDQPTLVQQDTSAHQHPAPAPTPTTQETSSPEAPASGAAKNAGATKGGKPAVQDPDVRDVVKHWATRWESRYEVTPEIQWPKACGMLTGIVRRHGVEETKGLIDQLFLTRDKFILDSKCDLEVFVRQINKIKVERRNDTTGGSRMLSDKTAGNLQSAQEAARLRGLVVST